MSEDWLRGELGSGDEDARLAAVRALLAAPTFEQAAIPRLLRLISEQGLNDASIAVRYYAKKAYDRLQGLQKRPDLAILLPSLINEEQWKQIEDAPTLVYGTTEYWLWELNSVDFKIRVKAVMELCKTPRPDLFDRLMAMFESESHEHVIATLVKYLAHFKRPELLAKTLPFLVHEDPRVRANTIEGIEILGDPSAVPDVLPLLRDPDNRVRANAAKFLVTVCPDEVGKTLAEMLASEEEWMRDSAVYLLGRLPVPEAEALLIQALDDGSVEIARKAVAALGTVGSSARTIQALEAFAARQGPLADTAAEAIARIRTRVG